MSEITEEITDESIAIKVQKGESQAFGLLVERYEPKLMRYARRFLIENEDAKDLIQDIFIKTYTNLNGFDTKRSFSSWIYRIAHNEFINAIKKKKTEPIPFFDPDEFFPHPIAKERPDQEIDAKQLHEIMEKSLNLLDAKYREPLVLYYYEDLDYKQISEVMRIPISTVGVRIRRAKDALQKTYTKSNNEPL